MHGAYAEEDIDAGNCMSLDCDAKIYKPVCGGLDAESAEGFQNECALQIYNCFHGTGTFFLLFFLSISSTHH